ncbi:hypothetical protein [Nonomuraea sp. LPB2021202275-12-8]|uniref:hypothetical protein n=1 Tax=Nonomuraea sp. LPB2021202275-12-8 TaxID=3120159 RepID=UPI00300D63D7
MSDRIPLGDSHPASTPPPDLAALAAKLADLFTGPEADFHIVLAQLVHRGEVRYQLQAPYGAKLELTLTDPTVSS